MHTDSSIPISTSALSQTVQPEPHSAVLPGQVIGGRYLVGTLIGQGGMGVVCAATHVGLDSPVAIKLIRSDLKEDAEFVERFLNEARRTASLKGEHIASVHDVGLLESGEPYLVMERLDGVELETYLRLEGPLEPTHAVDLVLQACEGLREAHAAGIVHRDLKPGNLFLAKRADGRQILKILDFGISKAVTEDKPSSLTNRSLGSPWYMSPEQMLDTSSVDYRADIWSLGVVLFELLTKTRPFDGSSVPEVCAKVLTAPPPTVRSIRPEIDPDLEAIVMRCLHKERDDRYSEVAALETDLLPFGSSYKRESMRSLHPEHRDTFGSIVPLESQIGLHPRRNRMAHTLGLVGILGSLVLAGWAIGMTVLTQSGGVPPALTLPWDPALASGPSAAALDRDIHVAPAIALSELVTPRAPAPKTVAASAPNSAAVPDAARANSLMASPNAGTGVAPRSVDDGDGVYTPPETPDSELTGEEIEARKSRYETWLKTQGLQRLEQASSTTRSELPTDSP